VTELVRQPGPADDVGQLIQVVEQGRQRQAAAAALGPFFLGRS
jgi:hypothetical protein